MKILSSARYKRAVISRDLHVVTVLCRTLDGKYHAANFKTVLGAKRWITRNETKMMWNLFDAE